jgi:starch-binding outer membrane protein, SusD/RagB family
MTATRRILALALLGAAACSTDRLQVPNYSNPTPETVIADPAAAVPFLVNGVLRADRGNIGGWITGTGMIGRESYSYSPTELRSFTGWVTADALQNTSNAGGGLWGGYYGVMRDIFGLTTVVESATDAQLPVASKNGVRGLAHTLEAEQLMYIILGRMANGAPVDIYPDATKLAPFVSRDSVFNHIIGKLDKAKTELQAAGTTFPFTLHSGYTGFSTPATFIRFNRALAARVNAYRASHGAAPCGAPRSATCYQLVLTNLSESFLAPTGSLTTGVYHVFSAAANEVANGISNAATTQVSAHANIDAGVERKADGTLENRFTSKHVKLATPRRSASDLFGLPTSWDHTVYPARDTPIPIIRNEELILLRAEARWFTGDKTGALADLNVVRTTAGGLPALATPASDDAFITALLYERRMSLMVEGHRWVDVRRFGRLNTLPLDFPSHVVVENLTVPQGECLQRERSGDPALKGPGC